METENTIEKPLSRPARTWLMLRVAGIIFLSYLFAAVSVLFLVTLASVELAGVIVLLRLGLAGFMIRLLRKHGSLIGVFFSCLWSKKAAEFRIALRPEEAPELFSLLTGLSQRLEVNPPDVVQIEMGVNAWVKLKGYRQGAGQTILGIGYDLLAGLSQREMEAVLAHEMVHAKLIRRGFKSWLGAGLGRIVRLATTLSGVVQAYRRAKQTFDLAEWFMEKADGLAKRGARLVAAYSRQDEFDADRGAAELCGAGPIKSSLVKLNELNRLAARLPWRERVAQMQLGQGFSQWLARELALAETMPPNGTEHEVFNNYSTHPLLRDRIAALPDTGQDAETDPRPAVLLLAKPDAVAEKLITEIQRVQAAEEVKDSKQLQAWGKKTRRRAKLQPNQSLGVFIMIGAVVGGFFVITGLHLPWPAWLVVLAAAGGGAALFKFGRYKDKNVLPIPDFSTLKESWSREPLKDIESRQKEIESEVLKPFAHAINEDKVAAALLLESFSALGRCDYLRAHVAARLSIKNNNRVIEPQIALAIASSALNQGAQWVHLLNALQKTTGLKSFNTAWGGAWTFILAGDWAAAEALLDFVLNLRPDNSTILSLRAICQGRRGKHQSAILSARQAVAADPQGCEQRKLLINLLVEGGWLREAQDQMAQMPEEHRKDKELILASVRLHLTQQNFAAAEEWTQHLQQAATGADTLIQLGGAYELARQHERAAGFYRQAVLSAHYPEALLGLARVEKERRNQEEARRFLLAALDTSKPPGPKGLGSLPLLGQILGHLVMLEKPAPKCHAWIASLRGGNAPPGLANKNFLVYATDPDGAENHFNAMIAAMNPGAPPLTDGTISWEAAPKEQQPAVPVRPGVQGILN